MEHAGEKCLQVATGGKNDLEKRGMNEEDRDEAEDESEEQETNERGNRC